MGVTKIWERCVPPLNCGSVADPLETCPSLPKFIEDCNRLLPDVAADSARCISWLCAHSTCRITMPAHELSAYG